VRCSIQHLFTYASNSHSHTRCIAQPKFVLFMLQFVAGCCRVIKCVKRSVHMHSSLLQCVTECQQCFLFKMSTLSHVPSRIPQMRSVCVAVWCSVMQCVAVCCSNHPNACCALYIYPNIYTWSIWYTQVYMLGYIHYFFSLSLKSHRILPQMRAVCVAVYCSVL